MWHSFIKRTTENKKTPRRARTVATAPVEMLEKRQMLSAAVATVQYDSTVISAATSSADIEGYTPAEIRKAYGFDLASFSGSSTAADGTGQTIAIVDAYNDPNIAADLKVFDSQFSLSDASLKVVNETGGSTLPSTDTGWAGEISLDVEWAHAIAPGANILLVEANSDSIADLMKAVNYARNASGVSVVSMSWGGSEFFSWSGGGESSSQTAYDSYFTTPTGHQGVTFVASAGDSGAQEGVQWPASSSNVLSVGGTSLTTDSTGTYVSESSWDGTSSGYSRIEVEPSYQSAVQTTGARSVADVSYDADPNTGFAVYDSLADEGYVGWQEVGGTSAGAPQWAALIAIADQGRVAANETTLDGPTQTLPMLYNLYGDTTTASADSTYSSTFNDVVDSSGGGGFNDPWHFRWGGGFGNNQSAATTGYDDVTGLGTPKAESVIDALIGTSSSSSSSGSSGSTSSGSSGTSGSSGSTNSGSSSGSSGSSGSTTVATLPASPLSGVFADTPIAGVIEGTSGTLELLLTNTTGSKFSGPVSVALYASTDNSLSSDDVLITTIDLSKVTIKADGAKEVKLRFSYPTTLSDGSYYTIGAITATGTGTAAAEVDGVSAVSIAAPTVDLSTTFTDGSRVVVTPGHGQNIAVTLTNNGNIMANGTLNLSLYASSASTLDTAAADILATLSGRVFHIRAGHSITLHLHFVAPMQTAGTYYLIASNASSSVPADGNSDNDVAVATTIS